jgi:hypothetical protein
VQKFYQNIKYHSVEEHKALGYHFLLASNYSTYPCFPNLLSLFPFNVEHLSNIIIAHRGRKIPIHSSSSLKQVGKGGGRVEPERRGEYLSQSWVENTNMTECMQWSSSSRQIGLPTVQHLFILMTFYIHCKGTIVTLLINPSIQCSNSYCIFCTEIRPVLPTLPTCLHGWDRAGGTDQRHYTLIDWRSPSLLSFKVGFVGNFVYLK